MEYSRTSLASRTVWSPWPRWSSSWPWPRSLNSLKIALSSAQGQNYFWTVEILLENGRNLAENLRRLFCFFLLEIAWKIWLKTFSFFEIAWKNLWRPFFGRRTLAPLSLVLGLDHSVLGLERVCPWKGCPCVPDSTSVRVYRFWLFFQNLDD